MVERRVLQLVAPKHQDEQRTSRTLAANIQILLPGEKARPHRHSMNALRFVLEGSGATTIVDGKPCPMEEDDVVLTKASGKKSGVANVASRYLQTFIIRPPVEKTSRA